MNKKEFEHIIELNKEFEYKYSRNLQHSVDNEKKWTNKGSVFVAKLIKSINWETLDSTLKLELVKNFSLVLKSKQGLPMQQIKQANDLILLLTIKNKKEYSDFKNKMRYPQAAHATRILLEKEQKTLAKKLVQINSRMNILAKYQNNFVLIKLKNRYDTKLLKTKLRAKDVASMITNKSIYRKIYLQDEPPLTPAGWIKLLVSYGLMLFWALIILWPLSELVKATLNNDATSYFDVPSYTFGFDSFERLFSKTLYLTWMKNTLFVAGLTSIATVFMTLLMGYAFSRFRFKERRASLVIMMLIQMVPTLASLTVFYVLYSILNQTYAISGLYLLLFIYIGGGVTGNTFIMKGYMDSISQEIDEAAKIDGLSHWRIFLKIILPLTKPMIALVALWSFMGPFNDYILSDLLLAKEADFTLAKGLRVLITDQRKIDQPAFAAGSLLIAMPIAVLFISLRNFLVSGITAGGVKG